MAFHTNFASHQLGQALAYSQPQARAAVAARCGGVCLLKALEQPALLLIGQADAGVAHLKAQRHQIARGMQ
ncbi:hypothetical protein D3C71_1839130 [compost metagenome]